MLKIISTPPFTAQPNALTLSEEAFHQTWTHGQSPHQEQLNKGLTDDGRARILDQFVAKHTMWIAEYDPPARYLARCGLPYPIHRT